MTHEHGSIEEIERITNTMDSVTGELPAETGAYPDDALECVP